MVEEKRSKSFSSRFRRNRKKDHDSGSEEESSAKRTLSFKRRSKGSSAKVEPSSASMPNFSDFKDLIDDDDPDETEGRQ